MKFWEKVIIPHQAIILLLILYFSLLLINLTLLPVFNDESIYLYWAWSHTHMPGHLYDSVLDAKQPLMVWIIAFFQNIFSDPVYAGRFASVFIGAFSALGIYLLTNKLFNKRAAIIATLLYTIIPIIVFYNRQALMEAGVECIGIWSGYYLLKLLEKPTTKNGVILGIILGLGYLIKSSSLLFAASSFLIVLLYVWKKRKFDLIKPFALSVGAFLFVNFILFINPDYWKNLSLNARYSYTPAEFFTFPVQVWLDHFLGFFEIGFIFITPLVFLSALAGIILIWKKGITYKTIILFFVTALILEFLSARVQNQRYIVAFLPFLAITASYLLALMWKGNMLKKLIVVLTFIPPIVFTAMLIFSPAQYIFQSQKFSHKYADWGHVLGQTSGYGITEAVRYIKDHSSPSVPNMVLFALNIGNPESAISVYSQKDSRLYGLHIDSTFFHDIGKYQCLSSQYPAFFVTREDQRVGMDRFFDLEKSFKNPYSNYSVRVYTLKKDCKGETLSLSDLYQPAIIKIFQMRSGIQSQQSLPNQPATLINLQ